MESGIAILGKHPGFGDFVSAGLTPELRDVLQNWMTKTYADAATRYGVGWQTLFDVAPPVRVWIGSAVLGMCLQGVIVPSRDKVGRRFPLLAVTHDSGLTPPPLSPDQAAYDRLEAHLRGLGEMGEVSDSSDLAQGASLESAPENVPETTLWAVNPDAGPGDLLQAVGSADYTRAAAQRSYWWCAPDDIRSSMLWSCTGLAGADALLWLMSGVARGSAEDHDEVCGVRD